MDDGAVLRGTRYADAIPVLVYQTQPEEGAEGQMRRARWLHYNVYSVPWRTSEILDVIVRRTGTPGLEGLRVLDLGCGVATMALNLALESMSPLVVGLDRDHAALVLAARATDALHVDRLKLIEGDLARAPLAQGSFDLILSYDSFYYAGIQREEALPGLHGLLREGGTLIIKVVNRLFPPYGILSAPGVRHVAGRMLRRSEAAAGRGFGFVQPAAPTSLGLAADFRRAGFEDVVVYDRLTRRDRAWARWFMPDVIVAGKHA